MGELAISCRGLAKRYGSVVALDGLELEVPQRSLFGFLGPNGAGKTTLMRLLMGLATPSEGTARVMGLDVVRESLEVRRRVGYLPQQPRFHDELTAREVLRYARGFYPRDPDSRVEDEITDSLDLVGLTAKADSRSGELSGGQRQRLGIAQAQIHRPELLILDEPAAALDPLGRRDVLDIMRRLRESATVFYSTHILDDVQRVSDEVAILKDGRRVLQSPMEELLAGDDGIEYVLELTGPVGLAAAVLGAQPWVAAVEHRPDGDRSVVTVRVSDDAAARRHLLRLVLRLDAVDVVGFGRRRSELEDVFLDVVGSGRHEHVGAAGTR
ncbi:ABC transporter ATP-binding protein [Georgenia sp. EYE_87]|uniref:ABC transporter ATP-binding protein n=1 Tax=Georgenia sp. EYE_87 TaxID=2853448 RepID=UPI002004158D|nr:ABC transporter ATP-binding protein [Georgenia sp. EYE_87]MCK6212020.1 ABC transporter ATP-binding protein [Georgenia sp. EYE_87]